MDNELKKIQDSLSLVFLLILYSDGTQELLNISISTNVFITVIENYFIYIL